MKMHSLNTPQDMLSLLLSRLKLPPYPAVIGISGAQGCGKSTLSALLAAHLSSLGMSAAAVSLDDYYLSGVQRTQLAGSVHPLLRQRGVPGTHDIQAAIKDAEAVLAGQSVALPRFDKALDEPMARRPFQQLDLLIVEGWCLGLKPQNETELALPVNDFEKELDPDGHFRRFVNQQLGALYQEFWQLLTPIIWLRAPDWPQICLWRAQQEAELRAKTGKGMNDTELRLFMASFERLTRASFIQLASSTDIQLRLNENHQVIAVTDNTA